ncbi:rCG25779, partial [Rattus norvegicus]
MPGLQNCKQSLASLGCEIPRGKLFTRYGLQREEPQPSSESTRKEEAMHRRGDVKLLEDAWWDNIGGFLPGVRAE